MSTSVPLVMTPEEAWSLWILVREPLTADEKRRFVNAVRLGVIRSERARIRLIAQKLKDDGKHGEACDFLLRLTGLPVLDALCSSLRISARGRAPCASLTTMTTVSGISRSGGILRLACGYATRTTEPGLSLT
jgi:hypothetical protein